MRGTVIVLAIIGVVTAVGPLASPASAFDVCGDCEDEDGDMSCSSAQPCEGKMPGFYCQIGEAIGKCNDIEHADCEDEPGEVCCGCEIFFWGKKSVSYEPASEIPDGDPGGWSSTINVDESFPCDFLDVAVDMVHENLDDLIITLSHNGIVVTLVEHPVCAVATQCEVTLALSDIGVGPVQCPSGDCETYFPGGLVMPNAAYTPAQPLSPLTMSSSVGDWTLTVVDTVPGGFGAVCGWELRFAQEGATPVDGPLSWGVIKALYR